MFNTDLGESKVSKENSMGVPERCSEAAEKVADPPGVLALLRHFLPVLEKVISFGSRVGDSAYFQNAAFPWVKDVEARASAVRNELDELLSANEPIPGFEEFSKEQRVLSDDRRWKTFFFFAYGLEVERNIEACPETWSAIQAIPGAVSACFSILEPGKALPTHRGPYKGVLRYHLAILIPNNGEDCGLIVNGEERRWIEGESIVFDDTYPHAAYNNSDELRVVLFVDFVRPMYFPVNLLNRLFLGTVRRSRYLRFMRDSLEAWRKERDFNVAAE